MIGNRLTLSIHQAICLLAAGVACPGWALAAPANLGEQALMAQSGAANARAPESAQFNSSFLSGQAKQVDLGDTPNLQRFFKRMDADEGVQRALKKQGL